MENTIIERVEQELEKPPSEKVPLPRIHELPESLVRITDQIRELTGQWSPVELYTASAQSRDREKDKFFKSFEHGEEYNPNFDYPSAQSRDFSDSTSKLQGLLHDIRIYQPSNQLERLAKIAIYFKIKDDLATARLAKAIKENDEEGVGAAVKQKYPGTDKQLLDKAQEIYERLCKGKRKKKKGEAMLTEEEQEFLKGKNVDAQGIKLAFEWALAQYGMLDQGQGDGYKVIVTRDVTSIDVNDKSVHGRVISIPEDKIVTADKLMELMTHEIEGHARQSTNGRKLFVIGGGPLMGDNDMLYEGLGKRYDDRFREKFFGDKSGEPLPFYTFAVKAAEDGNSFYQIFEDQLDRKLHVNLEINPNEPIDISTVDDKELEEAMNSAWLTTYRIMRGHVDTTNPNYFAMAKDLAYLRGWMLDNELVEEDAGYLNEAAVTHYKALKLLARFDMDEGDLPVPFKDITVKYWEEVLKPQMQAAK